MTTHPDDAALETVLVPAPASAPANLIPAPFQFLLTGEDNLRLATWNSRPASTIVCSGRILRDTGEILPFRHEIALTTTRLIQRTLLPLGPGALLNVVVAMNNNVASGTTFAKLEVVRGFTGAITPLGTLTQAYLGSTHSTAWPGALLEDPRSGDGELVTATAADPAAGAEVSVSVPVGARWRVESFHGQLTTDATVANRRPVLILDDSGAFQVARVASSATQAASLTMNYMWNRGVSVDPVVTEQGQGLLPTDGTLISGWRIRTSTFNLQAADDWAAPQLLVREWLEAFEL
jgi:hypothetical protein